jgi:hypothetical protein
MSQIPKQVWPRLSDKLQKEIVTELLHICQEVFYEHIRINNITTFSTQGHHLHSPVNAASNPDQPRKPKITVGA